MRAELAWWIVGDVCAADMHARGIGALIVHEWYEDWHITVGKLVDGTLAADVAVHDLMLLMRVWGDATPTAWPKYALS